MCALYTIIQPILNLVPTGLTYLVSLDRHCLFRIVLPVEPHVGNGILILHAKIKLHNLAEEINIGTSYMMCSSGHKLACIAVL